MESGGGDKGANIYREDGDGDGDTEDVEQGDCIGLESTTKCVVPYGSVLFGFIFNHFHLDGICFLGCCGRIFGYHHVMFGRGWRWALFHLSSNLE